MDLYPYALFFHILGAIGVFVGFGLQAVAVARMRRVSSRDELIGWMGVMGAPRVLAPISMLVILATGLYMVATRWSLDSWAGAGLVGLLVLGAIGGLVTGRTMLAIGRMLPAEGDMLSPAMRARLSAPTLTLALWLETGLAIAIVAVMVVKPGFLTSIGVLVAGSVVGAGAGVAAQRAAPQVIADLGGTEGDDAAHGASGAA